jgi:hypothetical protein
MFPTDEFHGSGIDHEDGEVILFMIPPTYLCRGTVGFHAARHVLNQSCHPG